MFAARVSPVVRAGGSAADGHPAPSGRRCAVRARGGRGSGKAGTGQPIDQHQRGVVGKRAVLVVEDGVREPPAHLRRGLAAGTVPLGHVHQPVEPEEGAPGVAGVGDAVV